MIAGTKHNSPKNFNNVKSQEAKGEEGGEYGDQHVSSTSWSSKMQTFLAYL